MLKRGILLIATDNPYYGKMAYNLALTLRAMDPNVDISLIFNQGALSHLTPLQADIFSHFIPLPPDIPGAFGAKMWMYDLSPYEETLYLDVDMVWLPQRTPADLFREVKDTNFSTISEGYYDIDNKDGSNGHPKYFYWAKPEDICDVYKLSTGRIYQFRSEVMYFKKCDQMAQFFATAKQIHEAHGLPEIKTFVKHVPDELAFNIAAAIHGVHPHRYKWHPSLWFNMQAETTHNMDTLYNKYYLLSCGSHESGSMTKKIYNAVVARACAIAGVRHLFPLVSKRLMIKERKLQ